MMNRQVVTELIHQLVSQCDEIPVALDSLLNLRLILREGINPNNIITEINNQITITDQTRIEYHDNSLSIDFNCLPGIYYNFGHFSSSYIYKFEYDSVGIICYGTGGYVYYDFSTATKITSQGSEITNNCIIPQIQSYVRFQNEFRKSEIVSFDNTENKVVYLVSPNQGVFAIQYIFPLTEDLDYSHFPESLELFSKRNKADGYSKILRNQIIAQLTTEQDTDRFYQLINKTKSIFEASDRNFELYIQNFDFNKVKDDFQKAKDDYFDSLRNSIDQIQGKVVSIPISITAAIIGIFNVNGDKLYIGFITFGYVVFTLFTSYLLKYIRTIILFIKVDFNKQVELITSQIKNSKDIISPEQKHLNNRIDQAKNLTYFLQVILSITSVILIMISLYQIKLKNYLFLGILLTIIFHIITSLDCVNSFKKIHTKIQKFFI